MSSPIRESSVGAHAKPIEVDAENGILREVCILREKGNCDYPREVREAAIPIIEGLRVYVDHLPLDTKTSERSYRDALGVVRGAYERGDGVFAREFHYNPKHPVAEQLAWDAKHAPEKVGFSIYGSASKRHTNGRFTATKINRLDSCDLVSTPAHGGGLYEGRIVKKKVSELIKELRESRPGWSKGLREQADSGVLSPDAEMEAPEEASPGEGADHEAALKQGFRAAVIAALDDDGLDLKAKLSKIKDILKTEEKLLGSKAEESRDESEDDRPENDEEYEQRGESRKKKPGNTREARLELKIRARDLLAEAEVRPSKIMLKAIDACKSESEVREIIDEAKKAGGAAEKPGARSSGPPARREEPVRESAQPQDDKARAERLAKYRAMG